MIYYGTEGDKQYLYAVMCTKHGGQQPYQVMRGCISNGEAKRGIWDPVKELACSATQDAAEESLQCYAKEHGLRDGGCGRCWHLREGAGGDTCDFFWEPLERISMGHLTLPIRCEGCLAWGECPPG